MPVFGYSLKNINSMHVFFQIAERLRYIIKQMEGSPVGFLNSFDIKNNKIHTAYFSTYYLN